jgi:hypothetical protein
VIQLLANPLAALPPGWTVADEIENALSYYEMTFLRARFPSSTRRGPWSVELTSNRVASFRMA